MTDFKQDSYVVCIQTCLRRTTYALKTTSSQSTSIQSNQNFDLRDNAAATTASIAHRERNDGVTLTMDFLGDYYAIYKEPGVGTDGPFIAGEQEAFVELPNIRNNPYLVKLERKQALKLRDRDKCLQLCQEKGPSGLFLLMFGKDMLMCMMAWTQAWLALLVRRANGNKKDMPRFKTITYEEVLCYIGAELYMGTRYMPCICNYWNHPVYGADSILGPFILQTKFEFIRANLQFHPPEAFELKWIDPLWHSRYMMEQFLQTSTSLIDPQGCMALDELTIWTRGRTLAKSYLPSKPSKYGIHLYALVMSTCAYMFKF